MDKKNIFKNNIQKLQVYGRYSLGSGSILKNPDRVYSQIDNHEIIDSYKKSIERDLAKAGIPLKSLQKYEVLDVGTGRQAIAFYNLGAKKIDHFDISEENVKRLKEFIKRKLLKNRITSKCVDLVQYSLPKNKFDLVFLHGIVQHFSNVGLGLANCLEAVKKGGYISLYFYRSGSFLNFTVELLRNLIKNSRDFREYFINSILLYSSGGQSNHFVSDFMDSLFVSYTHLYTPQNYIDFVSAFGFKIISSSKLDPLGRNVDHTFSHPSVVLTCQKIRDAKNSEKSDALVILSPQKSINQLDVKNYSLNDKEIVQTIKDYNALKKTLLAKKIPNSIIISIALRIYKFLYELDNSLDRVIETQEGKERHQTLQKFLRDFNNLLKEEF